VGLTRGTSRSHLVRAALEAMAYQVRDVVEQVREETGVALSELKVDGGAAANSWLMQFQADVVGARVGRPDIVETTALGAAGLAGLAAGVWSRAEDFLQARRYQWFEPQDGHEAGYAGWRRAVGAALAWSGAPDKGTLR
jgi:glycerol kinase